MRWKTLRTRRRRVFFTSKPRTQIQPKIPLALAGAVVAAPAAGLVEMEVIICPGFSVGVWRLAEFPLPLRIPLLGQGAEMCPR